MKKPPRAMCFVAMPFHKKKPPGKGQVEVDFDLVYKCIKKAVTAAGLKCVRADSESAGGFVQRPMYEALLVAEYVVADLSLANPNVMYEVGVRHGSRANATLLVCARRFVRMLPFDVQPFRVLTYEIDASGKLPKSKCKAFQNDLTTRLREMVNDESPDDNPILQVTASDSAGFASHEKTDIFLKRMRYAGDSGRRVYKALKGKKENILPKLRKIEKEVLGGSQVVAQLHTTLLALYLGYREIKAYRRMVSLSGKLPQELRRTPVVIEQLALALNRLAENKVGEGKLEKAERLRRKALDVLEELPGKDWSSETYGIAGRIYKAQAEAEPATERGAGALAKAIEMYEKGFRLDPRDYFPGVNAVTLRIRRGTPADFSVLATLLPTVRFSVNRAPAPETKEENYWQEATKVELACAEKDWEDARSLLPSLLAIRVPDWFRESTTKNLEIQKKAFSDDAKAVGELDYISGVLKPA